MIYDVLSLYIYIYMYIYICIYTYIRTYTVALHAVLYALHAHHELYMICCVAFRPHQSLHSLSASYPTPMFPNVLAVSALQRKL